MRLTIDNTKKIIEVKESINLEELYKVLQEILPEIWKKYNLEIPTLINLGNTIYIKEVQPYIQTYISPDNSYNPPFHTTCNTMEK